MYFQIGLSKIRSRHYESGFIVSTMTCLCICLDCEKSGLSGSKVKGLLEIKTQSISPSRGLGTCRKVRKEILMFVFQNTPKQCCDITTLNYSHCSGRRQNIEFANEFVDIPTMFGIALETSSKISLASCSLLMQ